MRERCACHREALSSRSAITDSLWETWETGLVESSRGQGEQGRILGGGEKPQDKCVDKTSGML